MKNNDRDSEKCKAFAEGLTSLNGLGIAESISTLKNESSPSADRLELSAEGVWEMTRFTSFFLLLSDSSFFFCGSQRGGVGVRGPQAEPEPEFEDVLLINELMPEERLAGLMETLKGVSETLILCLSGQSGPNVSLITPYQSLVVTRCFLSSCQPGWV